MFVENKAKVTRRVGCDTVSSKKELILASCCLRPMRINSVLEELRDRSHSEKRDKSTKWSVIHDKKKRNKNGTSDNTVGEEEKLLSHLARTVIRQVRLKQDYQSKTDP